jgi:hypothetical protein
MLNGYGLMVNSSTGAGRGDIPSPTGETEKLNIVKNA